MIERYVEKVINAFPELQEQSLTLSRAIHDLVMGSGESGRKITDLLHGTWLGHPFHPVLTDIVIGAWSIGALFDVLSVVRGDRYSQEVGDTLAKTGTAAAVPTIITGLADYSTAQKPAVSAATLHALLNDINFGLYLLSLRDRRRGRRRRGIFFSLLAVALTIVSAWLGGYLVYDKKVGVDHSEAKGPDDWTPVLDASDLSEGEPKRVDADGNPVLLFRIGGRIHAIDAVCSHAGGPLDEGSFDGCYVQCPWHDSVFDVRDGRVKHGPATRPQPNFAVRERDGRIELRLLER